MDKQITINHGQETTQKKSPIAHLLLTGMLLALLAQLTGLLINYFNHISIWNNFAQLAKSEKNLIISGVIVVLYVLLWGMEIKWLKEGYKLLKESQSDSEDSEGVSTAVGGYQSNWQTMQNPFLEGKVRNAHPSVSHQKNINKQ